MTLRIVLSGMDVCEKDLSKSPTLGRGKQGSKMDDEDDDDDDDDDYDDDTEKFTV